MTDGTATAETKVSAHERPAHKAGLLILRRRKGECVIIGEGPDKIKLMVTEIGESRVALGFAAPWDVPIHREEIYNQLHPFEGDAVDIGGEAGGA